MDFFASQELARKKTKWLVIYFALAVLAMIFGIYLILVIVLSSTQDKSTISGNEAFDAGQLVNLPLFLMVSLGVVFVIGCGSLYKIMELRSGGSSVANSLGGRRLMPNSTDLAERRILNVVEEMALAAGISVPPVYVLDKEPGINAFAAGHNIDDAVIGVNRGTIEQLNRDELQGVIAHEFSHILNGDMRMSLRMIGVLHGIQLLALIGFFVLRGSHFRSSRNNNGAGAVIAVALALLVFGSIGLFFARLIKASLSRQREFLADASAVQFTRNPEGISGALKMIGASSNHGALNTPNAEVASHMFFANMFKSQKLNLLATHPPLINRIQKIDPQFSGDFKEYMTSRLTASVLSERRKRKSAAPPVTQKPFGFGGKFTPGDAASRFPIDPVMVVAGIGLPDESDVEYSQNIVEHIPQAIAEAAREVFSARCLVFATLINASENEISITQIESIRNLEGEATLGEVKKLRTETDKLAPTFRLPVFEIVQGTLVGMSPEQFDTFSKTVRSLIHADGKISLFEFFLQHHLLIHLERHFGRKPTPNVKHNSVYVLQKEISVMLGVLVDAGHEDSELAEQAFAKSMETLGQGQWGGSHQFRSLVIDKNALETAITKLSAANAKIKKQVLLSAAAAITFDGKVTVEEAELFRAFSESIDCPIPPVVTSEIEALNKIPT